jgi:ribosomal protein S18 acetylase RimI-like enzyme
MSEKHRIVPLAGHDRSRFSCGVEVLDRYLREQATQDMRRKVSNCFIAVDSTDEIAAYYTFAAAQVASSDLPSEVRKKLPRYSYLPAALVGRLAVDRRFQRQRLGESLVADAAARAEQSAAAIFALIVDAKNESAVAFYRWLGFQHLLNRPMSLFLPVATARRVGSK